MADISVMKSDLKMSQAEMDSMGKNTLETVLKSLLATKMAKLGWKWLVITFVRELDWEGTLEADA